MQEQTNLEKVRTSVERMVRNYGERGPYKLYPDETRVESLIDGLTHNKIRYGKAFCPCIPVEDSLGKGNSNVCPCDAHHEDIKRDGCCECALFVSPDFSLRVPGDPETVDEGA
ncbi:MAG: ferredoxin:thioredoxin reductase [Planctomycetes bacterium]|nr:ferredoxin:thioredoxin reductase [Planctomycetota bacterium]